MRTRSGPLERGNFWGQTVFQAKLLFLAVWQDIGIPPNDEAGVRVG